MGKGGRRWGKMETIYLSLHCHHQNDFYIKMGRGKNHFNVSLIVRGKRHKTVSTDHNLFLRERRAEAESSRGPSAYQPKALPLGHNGSPEAGTRQLNFIRLKEACMRVVLWAPMCEYQAMTWKAPNPDLD